jgi:hypothetical protein
MDMMMPDDFRAPHLGLKDSLDDDFGDDFKEDFKDDTKAAKGDAVDE